MADKYAVYKKQLKEEEKKYKNLVNESEKVFNNGLTDTLVIC